MFRELAEHGSIFDLPKRAFFLGDPGRDLSVRFHGLPASTPFGPAAGPHSQLAQNIVLAFLGGARIFELKTVQVKDELEIPRPCIDMRNVGYNVEWSQELRLPQSLEEYVKASMLIKMLCESGKLDIPEEMRHVIYDMSVGYDLAGIKSESVQGFIRGMKNAKDVVDRLRGEIPAAHKALRELDFETRLSKTLTLSTFHGCPPDEIEKIIEYLLDEHKLHCVTKLNPTLLGPKELRRLMHDAMGYRGVHTPDSAFEKDARWEQVVDFAERLSKKAAGLGLSYGVKFSNTLIVENRPGGFLPVSEGEMYLSGPPLHVLAMSLVRRFREQFADRIPISFSAGIDRMNFPDAVALGLVPVTVCSDLLKPGGYARAKGYFDELSVRMRTAGAADIDEFILKARGWSDAALKKAGLKEAPKPGTK
ncbi:MAG: glutamate synthase, partial [Elusimicrobiota bacterium]